MSRWQAIWSMPLCLYVCALWPDKDAAKAFEHQSSLWRWQQLLMQHNYDALDEHQSNSKCGGFTPTREEEEEVGKLSGVGRKNGEKWVARQIFRRHQMRSVVSRELEKKYIQSEIADYEKLKVDAWASCRVNELSRKCVKCKACGTVWESITSSSFCS